MAVTKNHLVYDILNIGRGGKVSDDDNISLRQIGYWVDNTRSLLIRRDLEKNRSINPALEQTLPCMEVARIDASECPCEVVGCTILRTVEQIPSTVELSNRNLITRVASIQIGTAPYSLIPYARAVFAGNHPATKKMIKAFVHNNYIYLIGDNPQLDTLEVISVSLNT